MTKAEFVDAIAQKGGYTKTDAQKALNAVIDTISDSLSKGEKIALVGFGTFSVKERSAKTAFNPRTKETIEVPAKKVPVFKAGKALKDVVA